MYCSRRNCHKDYFLDIDNDFYLCKEHFLEYKEKLKNQIEKKEVGNVT